LAGVFEFTFGLGRVNNKEWRNWKINLGSVINWGQFKQLYQSLQEKGVIHM